MIEQLATEFERKILFGLGRHISNALGVAGVMATLIGGGLWVASREQPVLTYVDWLKREKGEDAAQVKEVIRQSPVVERWQTRCSEAILQGDPYDYCNYYQEKKARLEGFEGDLRREYQAYAKPRREANAASASRGILAPIILGWGAGTVVTFSLVSALLSIERNTRK